MKQITMQTPSDIQEVMQAVKMQDADRERDVTVVTVTMSGRTWRVNSMHENGVMVASCSSYPNSFVENGTGLTYKIYSLYEYGAMIAAIRQKEQN